MTTPQARLFRIAAYGWLAFYLVAMLFLGSAAWTNAPVGLFRSDEAAFKGLEDTINGLPPAWMILITSATLGLSVALLVRHRWWLGLVAWLLFRIITHRTWLASNGGIQLMENMLIWGALMGKGVHPVMSTAAFWIARLQLLVVYAVAAAHKFTGTAWLDGSAMMMVAHDPEFDLGWLIGAPWLCTVLTYATLAFMTLFPLAVWWRPARRVFLLIGMLFHLATAVFMGIPQMGLAFIACYTIWLDAPIAERIIAWSWGARSAPGTAIT